MEDFLKTMELETPTHEISFIENFGSFVEKTKRNFII